MESGSSIASSLSSERKRTQYCKPGGRQDAADADAASTKHPHTQAMPREARTTVAASSCMVSDIGPLT